MRGSLVLELATPLKNEVVPVFRTPSATPVALLKVTMRLFTATMNCDGPTAPIESGGRENVGFVPESVAPVKLVLIVCAASGAGKRPNAAASPKLPNAPAGGDFGFCGSPLRSG